MQTKTPKRECVTSHYTKQAMRKTILDYVSHQLPRNHTVLLGMRLRCLTTFWNSIFFLRHALSRLISLTLTPAPNPTRGQYMIHITNDAPMIRWSWIPTRASQTEDQREGMTGSDLTE